MGILLGILLGILWDTLRMGWEYCRNALLFLVEALVAPVGPASFFDSRYGYYSWIVGYSVASVKRDGCRETKTLRSRAK